MIINPGLLKHNIVIYRYTETVDPEGFKTKTHKVVLKCKAALEKYQTTDSDFGATSTINIVRPKIKCVIRFADINNNDKVELNGIRYSITDIEDINFERRFLRITLANE